MSFILDMCQGMHSGFRGRKLFLQYAWEVNADRSRELSNWGHYQQRSYAYIAPKFCLETTQDYASIHRKELGAYGTESNVSFV